jgi:hypothetical protein
MRLVPIFVRYLASPEKYFTRLGAEPVNKYVDFRPLRCCCMAALIGFGRYRQRGDQDSNAME